MLSMSQRAPGYRLYNQVPPTFSAISSTRVRSPSCRSRCSVYRPEKPAPIMSASKRASASTIVTADLQDGSGQVQGFDPPGAVLFLVCLAVVTGAVQLVAVAEDDPVLHCPNAGGGHGRGEVDFRGVAMVHRGRILKAAKHHRNEVVSALWPLRGQGCHRVGPAGG